MENKVLYNLDKIISVYVYKKKVNKWFEVKILNRKVIIGGRYLG